MIGEPGTGFATAMRTLDHTRVTIAAQAVGIAQGALDYATGVRQGAQAVRQGRRRVPGHPVHARRHGHEARGRPPADVRGGRPSERGDADLTYFGAAAKCFASDVAMEITTDAVQLLGGYGYTRTSRWSG